MTNHYKAISQTDSFIAEYMDSVSHLETPLEYDFWCAVWLVSLAVGRQLIVRPTVPVYLNQYILLVSESGVTRKSTAVNFATKVARLFIEQLAEYNRHIELIETNMSPEELEKRAHVLTGQHGYAQIAVAVSELVRFLGRSAYSIELPGLLTDYYDSPEHRTGGGTIKRGPTLIKDLYLCFLSASTPSWLSRAVNPDVVEGGFTSRILPIHAERRKQRVSWPNKTGVGERQGQLAGSLLGLHLASRELGPTIELDSRSFTAFDKWYNGRKEHKDSYQSSFESREDDHVLRLAAILSASANDWVITNRTLKPAIELIASVKREGARLFAGKNEPIDDLSVGVERLQQILLCERGTNTITQTELHRRVRRYFDREQFHLILHIMKELELIKAYEPAEKTVGRPTTYWRATNNLAAVKDITEVMRHEISMRKRGAF